MILKTIAEHEKAELIHSLEQVLTAVKTAAKAKHRGERDSERAMRLGTLARRAETLSGLIADVRRAEAS